MPDLVFGIPVNNHSIEAKQRFVDGVKEISPASLGEAFGELPQRQRILESKAPTGQPNKLLEVSPAAELLAQIVGQ